MCTVLTSSRGFEVEVSFLRLDLTAPLNVEMKNLRQGNSWVRFLLGAAGQVFCLSSVSSIVANLQFTHMHVK